MVRLMKWKKESVIVTLKCVSAAWKIIKGWLPAPAVKKIKFVNKSSISDYVSPDQQLFAWGGTKCHFEDIVT